MEDMLRFGQQAAKASTRWRNRLGKVPATSLPSSASRFPEATFAHCMDTCSSALTGSARYTLSSGRILALWGILGGCSLASACRGSLASPPYAALARCVDGTFVACRNCSACAEATTSQITPATRQGEVVSSPARHSRVPHHTNPRLASGRRLIVMALVDT
eukprot:2220355-Amphidinium_carterae.1